MDKERFILGTHNSAFAIAQALSVKERLEEKWSEKFKIELKIIKPSKDKHPKEPHAKVVDAQLISGDIDFAVHSLKNLPLRLEDEFEIAAVPKRGSARDVLVLKRGIEVGNLRPGALIFTSNTRRKFQWLEKHPETCVETIRGDLDTKLRKFRESQGDGMIVAEIGFHRLKPDVDDLHLYQLTFDHMLPAPGQGAFAIQIRKDDNRVKPFVEILHDSVTAMCVEAERSFLDAMGGDDQLPLGSYAENLGSGGVKLTGVFYDETGKAFREFIEGRLSDARQLGKKLAVKLKRTPEP